MIRFRCPSCKSSLSSDDNKAGTKVHCGVCGQKLMVPKPQLQKTVLGQLEPPTPEPPSPATPLQTTPSGKSIRKYPYWLFGVVGGSALLLLLFCGGGIAIWSQLGGDSSDPSWKKLENIVSGNKSNNAAKRGHLKYQIIQVQEAGFATVIVLVKNESETKLENYEYRKALDRKRIKIIDNFGNEYRVIRAIEPYSTSAISPGKAAARYFTINPVVKKATKLTVTLPTGVEGESAVTLSVPLNRTEVGNNAFMLYEDRKLMKKEGMIPQ